MMGIIGVVKKLIVSAALVLMVSACTQVKTKPVDSSMDRPSELEKGLTETLNPEQEYKLALDLAELDVKRNNFERATSILDKLRKESPKDVRPYRLLAKIFEKQGKIDLALVSLQEINKLHSHTLDDESELARLALMKQNYVLAEKVYRGWLISTEVSVNVSALNNLGFAALLQKRYADANVYFNRALVLDPLNSRALNNLALVTTLLE